MKECKFCEALTSWVNVNDFYADEKPDPELGTYCHEYTVALVIRSWYQKRGKRHAGRTVDYRYRGLGFKLNYCPECGKSLGQRRADG